MTKEQCINRKYPHNQRCRYTDGFYCEDCGNYFPKESPDYRRHELSNSLSLVCWNISAEHVRQYGIQLQSALEMEKKLTAISNKMSDSEVEILLAEALCFIEAHGKNSESASLVLK